MDRNGDQAAGLQTLVEDIANRMQPTDIQRSGSPGGDDFVASISEEL
jgi:hypothetical protein